MVFCAVDAIAQSPDAGIAEAPAAEVPVAESAVEPAAETADSEVDGKTDGDEDVTLTELIDMFFKVISDFRSVGLLLGFISLIGLLVLILRIKALNVWLEKKGWKKYKPYVAAVLAAVVGFLGAMASGKSWVEALAAGIAAGVAGLASTGGHQLLTGGNK